MSRSSVPDSVPAIRLNRNVPGLSWSRDQLRSLTGVLSLNPPQSVDIGSIPENTPVELESDTFVVIGKRLGEGLQGSVYEVSTTDKACVKVCRNDKAAKQFRRELAGRDEFDRLGIEYPVIFGADGRGRWIVKERWYDSEHTGTAAIEAGGRVLPTQLIHALYGYVHSFQNAGICADWMPSNVVFRNGKCASFETSVWNLHSHPGWTFGGCFLPVWIPDGVQASSLVGFPPYSWSTEHLAAARRAWMTNPAYETWRDLFGDFPSLCSDWWKT